MVRLFIYVLPGENKIVVLLNCPSSSAAAANKSISENVYHQHSSQQQHIIFVAIINWILRDSSDITYIWRIAADADAIVANIAAVSLYVWLAGDRRQLCQAFTKVHHNANHHHPPAHQARCQQIT